MKIQSRHRNFETAIDEENIREWFQKEFKRIRGNDIEISDLFVTRVFPRKEGGFTIQYELHLEKSKSAGQEKLILCGHLLGPGEKSPAYLQKSPGNCIFLDDIGLVVPIFPYDPGLPALDELTRIENKSPVAEKLKTVLGVELVIRNFDVLGYRLEKRCVIRYDAELKDESSAARKIVAKAYRPSAFSRAQNMIEMLEDKGFRRNPPEGFTVPRVLGSDGESGVIFMENAPGISLHFLMDKNIFVNACSATGGVLSKLHRLNTDGLKSHTKLDELGNLRKLLELIYYMYPKFKDSFDKELDNLTKNAGAEYSEYVFSHRDFFDKQMLFSENRTTLIDYDNAAAADPALDTGNFIAHLALRKLQHPGCSDNIQRGIEAFTESYGDFQEAFFIRTIWWLRASRLRLAALYLLRPRWRDLACELLTLPIDLLGQQVPGGINGK